MRALVVALQFLTIIPIRINNFSERDIGRAVTWFPVVGAVQGAFLYLSMLILIRFFGLELSSAILISLLLMTNGGLHIDGLADTFDGLGANTMEKRLAAMKDSSTGPIGVVSIIMVLLIKFIALKSLLIDERAALFLMPVLGRWSMVPAIYTSIAARDSGLGNLFINYTGIKEV
ncbi:MAG: adenosylcobinamide-GDP ribazoletransferase, partial [Nitrospirae bacterium]